MSAPWKMGLSTGACAEAAILDMLPHLHASGVTGVEVGTPPAHFDHLQESQILALASELAHRGMAAVSIHAPFGGTLDLADPDPHRRHAGIGAALSAADAIKRLGGELVIVHPSDLVRHAHDVRARLADGAESLRLLGRHCRALGVTLVVESPLPHLIGGHPDEFAWLLERTDEATRVCLDTGHTSLGHHWQAFVDVAGSRLVHIHANDNHGHWDDHLPPGDGRIDWAAIASSLRRAEFTGWIMLELQCPVEDPTRYFSRAVTQAAALFADPSGDSPSHVTTSATEPAVFPGASKP